jgi:hypothetical protein
MFPKKYMPLTAANAQYDQGAYSNTLNFGVF